MLTFNSPAHPIEPTYKKDVRMTYSSRDNNILSFDPKIKPAPMKSFRANKNQTRPVEDVISSPKISKINQTNAPPKKSAYQAKIDAR